MSQQRTRLTFNAIPFSFESPRSLLLRVARNNGFLRTSELAKSLTRRGTFSTNELFVGRGRFYQELLAEAGHLSAQLASCFLAGNRLREGDKYSYYGASVPEWAMSSTRLFRNCPACSEQGWFDMTVDLLFVRVCHRHNLLLMERCHACNAKLSITACVANLCQCGAALADSPSVAADGRHISEFFRLISSKRFDQLKHFFAFLRGHQLWRESTDEELRVSTLDALEYAIGPKAYLASRTDALLSNEADLPARALLASELVSTHPIVRKYAEDRLKALYIARSEDLSGFKQLTAPTHLSIKEVSTALQVPERTVLDLMEIGALTACMDNKSQIDSLSLSALYKALSPHRKTLASDKRMLTSTDGAVLPLTECIAGVLQGKFEPQFFRPERGLKSLRVGLAPLLNKPVSRRDFISLREAAISSYTTPETMLRSMIRTCLASAIYLDCDGGKHLKRSDHESFQRTYITMGELSIRLKRRPEDLLLSLTEKNVIPAYTSPRQRVSTHIFLRKKVADLLSNGRGTSDLIPNEPALTAGRVANILGVTVNFVTKLARQQVLETTDAGKSTNRLYTRESVDRTKKQLAGLVGIGDVIRATGLCRDELFEAHIKPNRIPSVWLGGMPYFKKDDYQEILRLCGRGRSKLA